MRPQNQSERQSAIYHFWAIYIIALLLPILAFYFLFKNSTNGLGNKDLQKMEKQIYEMEKIIKVLKQTDSLTTELVKVDFKLKDSGINPSEKVNLEQTAKQVVENLENQVKFLEKNIADNKVRFENTKEYFLHMPIVIKNLILYHNYFQRNISLGADENSKDLEIANLKEENRKLNNEIGKLTAEVTVLQKQ